MVDIVEVKMKIMPEEPLPFVAAYLNLQLACLDLVIYDVKIVKVRTKEGFVKYLVQLPDRPITDHCPQCGTKNQLIARYCQICGIRLADDRVPYDDDGRSRRFTQLVFPCTERGRAEINRVVLETYLLMLERGFSEATATIGAEGIVLNRLALAS